MKKIILLILVCIGYLYPQASNTIPRRVDTLETETDSLFGYWVNKHEAQTIIGQKNFMGTVKIAPDTSMWLGYKDGNYNTGLTIYQNAGHPYGYNRIFKSVPLDSYSPAWSLVTGIVDFVPANNGVDHTITLAANWDREQPTLPIWGWQLENNYESDDTTNIYEWFWFFYDKAVSPTYSVRPWQGAVRIYNSGRKEILTNYDTDEFWIGRTGYTLDRFNFNLKYGYLYMNDSTYVVNYTNNWDWLMQVDSTGTNGISMIKVDNLNRVVISPSSYYDILFASPIDSSLRWRNNANDGFITVQPDTNDILNITGNGVHVPKLQVNFFYEDTTGLEPGDLVIDPTTHVVRAIKGKNIVTNGEFNDWTADDPDSWSLSTEDAGNYVTEDPTGSARFVTDGTAQGFQLYQYNILDSLETYGYAIKITSASANDTLVFGLGEFAGIYIYDEGVYTGEFTASGFPRNVTLRNNYGAIDFTIAYVRIWKKTGGVIESGVTPQKAPVNAWDISLAKTIMVEWGDGSLTYDSIKVADVQDSLCIQAYWMDGITEKDMIATPDTLTAGDTTILFDQNRTVTQGSKVYIKFIYIGDNEADLKSKIYWREL